MPEGSNRHAILSIHIKKCEHMNRDIQKVDCFPIEKSMRDIFQEEHFSEYADVKVSSSLGTISNMELTVGEIQELDIKKITMECVKIECMPSDDVTETPEMKRVNALELVMKGGSALPSKLKR